MYSSRKYRRPARLTNGKYNPATARLMDTICNLGLIIAIALLVFHLAGLAGLI